jgi:hypothetical protein
MFDLEPNICAPEGAQWAELTDDLLQSGEGERWRELADRFEPVPPDPSMEMTNSLREGIRRRSMHSQPTRALHNHELLGFYAIEQVLADISNRSGPLLGAARRLKLRTPQRGWLVSSIVRSASTEPGFGQVLLEGVVGEALTDKSIEAIFVEPANERVGRMWRETYRFEPVASSEIPGLLYLPLKVGPDASPP